MRGPPIPTETELKLAIAPGAVAGLARHPAVVACKRGRARTARLVSVYYDTADDWLAQQGVALRLRRDGRRWVQTVKGPQAGSSAGGMSTRAEFEWVVSGGELDPLRFSATPFRRVLAKALRRGLGARFTTDFKRTSIPLVFPDSTWATLRIDVGEIRIDGAQRPLRTPLHELEIELEAGDVLRLYELAHRLAADVAIVPELRSKAQRGVALRRPQTAKPVHAAGAEFAADSTTATALQAIMRSCLAQIEANAPGLIADDDPEWVHQMRIGVRRLRACLSLARRVVATARIEPLRVELRWLAQALGPARDLDVFATQTLPAVNGAVTMSGDDDSLRTALHELTQQAAERRAGARALARSAVASSRYVRLVLYSAALAAASSAGPTGDAGHRALLGAPARDFARPLLKRRQRALLDLGADLAHAAPETRHAARLAAKNLRYATEFFAPLFPHKRTRAFRKALETLQDELGAWNDAAVATHLAGELAGSPSLAAAAFGGWAAARAHARDRALDAAWSAFSKARPFWSRR